MMPSKDEIAATVEEWSTRWNEDWKHMVAGVSERTGLTARDVILFLLLVEMRLQGQVNMRFYDMLLGAQNPEPETEERQTFG